MPQAKKTSSGKSGAKARRASSAPENVRVAKKTLSRTSKSGLPAARREVKRQNYVIQTRRDAVRKPFPYAIVFAILAIVLVAMYVLSLRITLDNLTADISRMEREIAASREEQNALEVRLNAKYDLTEIERIAKDEYGMVNKDTLTKKYISISGEDQIEVLEKTDSENGSEDEKDTQEAEENEKDEAS